MYEKVCRKRRRCAPPFSRYSRKTSCVAKMTLHQGEGYGSWQLLTEKRDVVRNWMKYSWPFGWFFLGGSPTLIWPLEGSSYPSRSCNGTIGPKRSKLKKKQQDEAERKSDVLNNLSVCRITTSIIIERTFLGHYCLAKCPVDKGIAQKR